MRTSGVRELSCRKLQAAHHKGFRLAVLGFLSISVSAVALGEQVVKITQNAWSGLLPLERAQIQQRYAVNLIDEKSFGVIIDNQGVNESTPGTNSGAYLGGAIANAAYVDNALKGGNYSLKTQLAAGLVGALLGSTLDSRPNSQYHFRYAVRLGNGEISYFDETKSDPFRHPVGVCISVPNIAIIEQQLCTQSVATLRAAYLSAPLVPEYRAPPTTPPDIAAGQVVTEGRASADLVNCKMGALQAVLTTVEKCELINGRIVK